MTNRIQRLKTALFQNNREISLERALLYTASHQQTEGSRLFCVGRKRPRISLSMLKFRFVMRS
jgi:pyruvate-formate lyase